MTTLKDIQQSIFILNERRSLKGASTNDMHTGTSVLNAKGINLKKIKISFIAHFCLTVLVLILFEDTSQINRI